MTKCKLITQCGESTMILATELPQAFPGMVVRKGWLHGVVEHVAYDLEEGTLRVGLMTGKDCNYDNLRLLGFREVDEFGEVTE